MLPSHQQHCSERSNQMTGEKYMNVHWRCSEKLERRARSQIWDITPCSCYSHQTQFYVYFLFLCCVLIIVSLIKMFVLCLFDKYLFETCEPVTEFCWKSEFQMRPLTQILSLLFESASGQITQTNIYSVTISVMKDQTLCSMIELSLLAG